MMRPLIIAVAFLMPLIYAVPVEACRCIGKGPSCSCLKGNGDRFDQADPEPVYNDYRKDHQKKYREKEAKRREEAKRQAEERQAELERQRQAKLERQRLEAERRQEEERRRALEAERQRIVRNLKWLSSILVPGAKPPPPKRDPEFDRDKADRRQDELSAKLARAAAAHQSRRPAVISDAQRRTLRKNLRNALSLGLDPYDHSIQALKGFDHFLHNRGAPMELPLSEIAIDHKVLKPEEKSISFKLELKRAPKGVPTRITFYNKYKPPSTPTRLFLLGTFSLKIEADLTVQGNKFTLTNVEVVGGCDIYNASKQKRPPLEHNITRVLSVISGTPYVIKLKGRVAVPDIEGEVPLEFPTVAKPPECAQSEQR